MNFIRTSAGPVVQIVKSLDPATAEAAWADMEKLSAVISGRTDGRVPMNCY